MNRYEEIKKIADRYYNGIENDENRALCFEHSQAVADCAKEIAEKGNTCVVKEYFIDDRYQEKIEKKEYNAIYQFLKTN